MEGLTMLPVESHRRSGWLVFSMALRIAQDYGAAEEITQDVFVRCWQSIDRYHPQQGSLAAWLLTITRHRAINELCSRRQPCPLPAPARSSRAALSPVRARASRAPPQCIAHQRRSRA